MIKPALAAAAVLTVGVVTVANASLSLRSPATPAAQAIGRTDPALAQTQARPEKVYAEVKNLAPVTLSDADETQGTRAAPRVIDLPRADTPNQAYVPAPVRTTPAERVSQAGPSAPAPAPSAYEEPAPRPEPAYVPPPRRGSRTAPSARPAEYRTASYHGGQGATWKTGRNEYGFEGTFGGCRFTGFSGPRGFKLDRNCR
jgi:hypothetical protein